MSDDRPPRPDPLPIEPGGVDDTLRRYPNWVCWRYEWRGDYGDDGEWTKVPIDPETGSRASSTDPETWATADDALGAHRRDDVKTDGIGFVFTDTPFVGIDLDHCRDAETGDREPWATTVLETVGPYAYVDVSPSGTGDHAIARAEKPGDRCRRDDVEMYDTDRFFTVTGRVVGEYDTAQGGDDAQEAVTAVYDEYLADDGGDDDAAAGGAHSDDVNLPPDTDGGGPTGGGSDLGDDELIELARSAENGEKFDRLWRGDTSGYESHSEADLALCGLLAFWTGGDRTQMDRLFRRSGLDREKWRRDDYRDPTITEALTGRTDFYSPSTPAAADGGATAATAASAAGDGDNEEVGDDEGADLWDTARGLFTSDTPGSTTRGYYATAQAILDDMAFACVRESGELYAYDPEAGYYSRKGETRLEEALAEHIPSQLNEQRITNITRQVRIASYVDADDFDPPEGKVCLANGVLDLDSGELHDHSPEWYFKTALPVAYDPDADGEEWRSFLRDAVPDDDERATLAEFVGYALEGWHHRHEKNLFIVGPRRSGKSTSADTITALFGDAPTTVTLSPQQLADTTFDSADLYEAMLNVRNDINATKIQDSGTLKTIFSGERQKGERKYKDAFYFEPTTKHLFTANWVPRVVGQDESLYRRIIIVEFPDKVPRDDVDRDLKQRLIDTELPGVLNWALEGRQRLADNGQFTHEPRPEDTRETWLSWRNAALRYLLASGEIEVTGDEHDTIERKTAYLAYKEWANREGYGIVPQQAFTKQWKIAPHVETVGDDAFAGVRFAGDDTDAGLDTDDGDDDGRRDDTDDEPTRGDIDDAIRNATDTLRRDDGTARRAAVVREARRDTGAGKDSVQTRIDALLENGDLQAPTETALERT